MRMSGFNGYGDEALEKSYANFCDKKDVKFTKIWNDAYQAGVEAVGKTKVNPMYVTGTNGRTGETKTWFVEDGVCGFAWVTVRPGNSAFANWGKKKGLFKAAYGGGVQYWVGEFNQSMQKKEAFAAAVAAKLREAGVNAYSDSRMD